VRLRDSLPRSRQSADSVATVARQVGAGGPGADASATQEDRVGIISKIAPTSASIQKEYVKKRQRELYKNDPAKTQRVQDALEVVMRRRGVTRDWYEVYKRIHDAMQQRDLTLNLEARNWFGQANEYDTYTQMYERGTANGRLGLKDDSFNPAVTRAVVDDLVTLPEEWKYASPFSQRKRLYDALNTSGERLSKRPNFGSATYKAPQLVGDGTTGVGTTNKKFKAKAKQVFAALNYGTRAHGSNTLYGYSHLVLNPVLKEDAIYFPCDTFVIYNQGTKSQATYNTIGALLDSGLTTELFDSCYENKVLADTDSTTSLLEAHLFKRIKIDQDVQALYLSRKVSRDKDPIENDEWDRIKVNARAWCKRFNVRLILMS
jgi:hypothetical protein